MSRLMLALDGSPLSEQAMPHALSLLRPDDELLLARVVEPMPEYGIPELLTQPPGGDTSEAASYLEGWVNCLAERGIRASAIRRFGWARESLVQIAAGQGVHTLVLSSRGRRGISRWLLGSVAESVCRHAPCATYLVHPGPGGEPLQPAPPVRKLLVPLDTSGLAEKALEKLPLFTGAQLTLLTVTDLPTYLPEAAVQDRVEERMHGYLTAQAERLRALGHEVSHELVSGYAADQIVDTAREGGYDAILLASHGRTGMPRWLLGSVAERVVRHSPCPVLVVPALTRALHEPEGGVRR